MDAVRAVVLWETFTQNEVEYEKCIFQRGAVPMLSSDKLQRLNELARKAKNDELSETEKREQRKLREEYLQRFRDEFRGHLDHIHVEPEAVPVKPKKQSYPFGLLRGIKGTDRTH